MLGAQISLKLILSGISVVMGRPTPEKIDDQIVSKKY